MNNRVIAQCRAGTEELANPTQAIPQSGAGPAMSKHMWLPRRLAPCSSSNQPSSGSDEDAQFPEVGGRLCLPLFRRHRIRHDSGLKAERSSRRGVTFRGQQ